MPVFISHKQEDSIQAVLIYNYLTNSGISCYLDEVDQLGNRSLSASALTSYIIGRIQQCSHLLAFVTPNTRQSWWVPFEIGTANQLEKKIVTANQSYDSLPEYLRTWPVLEISSTSVLLRQLDSFIHLYKSDSVVAKSVNERSYSQTRNITQDEFTRSLKQSLGQR